MRKKVTVWVILGACVLAALVVGAQAAFNLLLPYLIFQKTQSLWLALLAFVVFLIISTVLIGLVILAWTKKEEQDLFKGISN